METGISKLLMRLKVAVRRKIGRPVKYTDVVIKELGEKLLVWIQEPNNYWLGDFAVENGMDLNRLGEFAEKDEDFQNVYKMAKQIQQNKLAKGSMKGVLVAAPTIFALKNVANWRDKRDVKQTGDIVIKTETPKDFEDDKF